MCNAFNHPPDCRCGWGPKDSIGALAGVGFEFTRVLKSYESFVYPNARCPVCQQKVYFYRSPHNGRVYFEELGPPWTKHPCMESANNKKAEPIYLPQQSYFMTCPPPNSEGWRPLKPKSLSRKFSTFYIEVEHPQFPGRFLALTLPLAGCSPIYWRIKEDFEPNYVEISLLDEGRFGDIQTWTHMIRVAQNFDEAKSLKDIYRDIFVAK